MDDPSFLDFNTDGVISPDEIAISIAMEDADDENEEDDSNELQ